MKTFTVHVTLRTGVTVPVETPAIDRNQARQIAMRNTHGAVSALCKSESQVVADWLYERRHNPSFPLIVGGVR